MVKILCLFGTNEKSGGKKMKNIFPKCFKNVVILNRYFSHNEESDIKNCGFFFK